MRLPAQPPSDDPMPRLPALRPVGSPGQSVSPVGSLFRPGPAECQGRAGVDQRERSKRGAGAVTGILMIRMVGALGNAISGAAAAEGLPAVHPGVAVARGRLMPSVHPGGDVASVGRRAGASRVRGLRIIQAMKTLGSLFLVLVTALAGAAADSVTLKDIAGDYFFGDGLGANCRLKVTARGRFTFQWDGCLGTYDKNKGTARVETGILHLAPKGPNDPDLIPGTPTEFYPVRWGGRLYLIPTNAIVEFCSAVNRGEEPRRGDFGEYYLRRKDVAKPAPGRPAVPEQWTRYLLEKPVHAKITELVGERQAWIDKGSGDGLLTGMILEAQEHDGHMLARVEVEAVERDRCRVMCRWDHSVLVVGQTVSSRLEE